MAKRLRSTKPTKPDCVMKLSIDTVSGVVEIHSGGGRKVRDADARAHVRSLERAISAAAKLFVVKERLRRGAFDQSCPHKAAWRVRKRYVVRETTRSVARARSMIEMPAVVYGHAQFCGRCGARVGDPEGALTMVLVGEQRRAS